MWKSVFAFVLVCFQVLASAPGAEAQEPQRFAPYFSCSIKADGISDCPQTADLKNGLALICALKDDGDRYCKLVPSAFCGLFLRNNPLYRKIDICTDPNETGTAAQMREVVIRARLALETLDAMGKYSDGHFGFLSIEDQEVRLLFAEYFERLRGLLGSKEIDCSLPLFEDLRKKVRDHESNLISRILKLDPSQETLDACRLAYACTMITAAQSYSKARGLFQGLATPHCSLITQNSGRLGEITFRNKHLGTIKLWTAESQPGYWMARGLAPDANWEDKMNSLLHTIRFGILPDQINGGPVDAYVNLYWILVWAHDILNHSGGMKSAPYSDRQLWIETTSR